VAAAITEGEIYKVLARKGKWLKLGCYDGNDALGWIRSDLVFGGEHALSGNSG
jgi:hypothetical protein